MNRHYYNAKQDYIENEKVYHESYKDNIEYINENGGEDLTLDQKHILIAVV